MIRTSLVVLSMVCLIGSALASDLTPEEQIITRQSGYRFMSWNMGKIKANLDGEFNPQQVSNAANAVAGIANSGMAALFGPGTDQAIGDVTTRAKPELFTDRDGVIEVARAFIAAANNLAEVADGGERAEVARAFGELGQACKSCHDKYRMK